MAISLFTENISRYSAALRWEYPVNEFSNTFDVKIRPFSRIQFEQSPGRLLLEDGSFVISDFFYAPIRWDDGAEIALEDGSLLFFEESADYQLFENITNDFLFVDELYPASTYQWSVRQTIEDNPPGEWAAPLSFWTNSELTVPYNLSVDNIGIHSAEFSCEYQPLEPEPNSNYFELRIIQKYGIVFEDGGRLLFEDNSTVLSEESPPFIFPMIAEDQDSPILWDDGSTFLLEDGAVYYNSLEENILLDNLLKGTSYNWGVRRLSNTGMPSEWSSWNTFWSGNDFNADLNESQSPDISSIISNAEIIGESAFFENNIDDSFNGNINVTVSTILGNLVEPSIDSFTTIANASINGIMVVSETTNDNINISAANIVRVTLLNLTEADAPDSIDIETHIIITYIDLSTNESTEPDAVNIDIKDFWIFGSICFKAGISIVLQSDISEFPNINIDTMHKENITICPIETP